jgi:hypothetical protein
VTKPDRLARSTADLLNLVDALTRRGIRLRILSMGGMELDTSQATSKLMLTTLAAMATFERELMLERQREGIRKAVEAGKYRGRAPTARRKSDAVQELREAGIGPAEIARRLSISRASVYRIILAQTAVRQCRSDELREVGPVAPATCRNQGSLCLLCAHGCRSDERHRFSEAVTHGREAKWLGWVESGLAASDVQC